MKPYFTILAGSITLALCGSAFAANVDVVITGSTAFRAQTNLSISKILTSPTAVYKGTDLGSSSFAIIRGTIGADTVTFKTSWSGAVGGTKSVSQSATVLTIADAEFTAASAVTASGTTLTGGTSIAATGTVALVAEVAMTDNYQASTAFASPVMTDTVVGVIGFKFVASNGAPAGLNNITQQLAQALWSTGQIPLAVFTNNPADQTISVFATGRDPDSGTRLTTFAESGIGVFSTVLQYKPTTSGSTVTGHAPYPAGTTTTGIPVGVGQSGETSGNTLRDNLKKTTLAGINGYYISYMGTNDADNAIAGGAKELTYGGTTYSLAAVQNGQYTFWCYEHLMYLPSLAAAKKSVADALATQIRTVDSPILLSTMTVSRAGDGALITPNY